MKCFFRKTIVFLPLSLLLFLGDAHQVFAQDIFWSTPEKINTSNNNAITPVFTTDAKGYLHTAWMELNKSGEGSDFWSGLNPGILYSYWNGDTWSNPVRVSQNTDWAGFPAITSTSDNIIYVFYTDYSPNPSNSLGRIMYRYTSDNGQTWSSESSVSTNISNSDAWSPQVAIDSSNNLHVIYNYFISVADGGTGTNDYYYTKWNGSVWSEPIKISTTSNVQHSAITVDSSNNPQVLLWDADSISGWPAGGIYYTYFNGSGWVSPTQISTTGLYPRIIKTSDNKLHAIWVSPNVGVQKLQIEYSRYESGSWTSPTIITSAADYSYWGMPYTGLTFDSQNNVYAGWGERLDNGTVDIRYKKWNGASWSSPFFMRNVEDLDTAFIYRDKWDNQHLSWSEYNSVADEWQFYYAAIPSNVSSYNPSSQMTITMGITGDTLKIPNNALAVNATISAQIGPVPASADPLVTTIPRSYTFRPHGTTFINGKTATATILYSDAELIGSDERNLKAYFWDATLGGGAGDWTSNSFSQSTNTNTNKLTATLPHFSLYGIRAPKISAQFQSPPNPYSGSSIPLSFKFINQVTNQPADPPTERTIMVENEDGTTNPTPFWDEYKAKLVDNEGSTIETLSYDTGQGSLGYDIATSTYTGNFSGSGLTEGDYTVEVYLASTIPVGSQTFHFTPQAEQVSVAFLPPLKDDTLYSLKDGSTLPVKFTLTYENGTWVEAPALPEDVIVVIRDSALNQRAKYLFGTGGDNVRYDPVTKQYIANVHTKELGLGVGTYKIEVLVKGQIQAQSPTGSTTFKITEPGKVKGANTP